MVALSSLTNCCWDRKLPRELETGIKDEVWTNGTRISVWNIPSGKTALPFQTFRCSRKFSTGTTQKVVYHLPSNRNFRKVFVNGKQQSLLTSREHSRKIVRFVIRFNESKNIGTYCVLDLCWNVKSYSSLEHDGDVRRLAQGCKLQILVSLRVHRTESQYFYLYRYRLGLCVKKCLYEKTNAVNL